MDENKQPQFKPLLVSVPEAARLIDSGESTVWDMLAKGELDAVKDGARTKIPMASIERHVATRPKARFQPLKPRRRADETPASSTDRASGIPSQPEIPKAPRGGFS